MKLLLGLQTNRNHPIVMPIDSEFPGNHQVIGRHNHADGSIIILFGDPEDLLMQHRIKT
jgi:hypothetical protein